MPFGKLSQCQLELSCHYNVLRHMKSNNTHLNYLSWPNIISQNALQLDYSNYKEFSLGQRLESHSMRSSVSSTCTPDTNSSKTMYFPCLLPLYFFFNFKKPAQILWTVCHCSQTKALVHETKINLETRSKFNVCVTLRSRSSYYRKQP